MIDVNTFSQNLHKFNEITDKQLKEFIIQTHDNYEQIQTNYNKPSSVTLSKIITTLTTQHNTLYDFFTICDDGDPSHTEMVEVLSLSDIVTYWPCLAQSLEKFPLLDNYVVVITCYYHECDQLSSVVENCPQYKVYLSAHPSQDISTKHSQYLELYYNSECGFMLVDNWFSNIIYHFYDVNHKAHYHKLHTLNGKIVKIAQYSDNHLHGVYIHFNINGSILFYLQCNKDSIDAQISKLHVFDHEQKLVYSREHNNIKHIEVS